MCQPKPGRRCAGHTRKEVQKVQERIAERYKIAKDGWFSQPGRDSSEKYTVSKGLSNDPMSEYLLRQLEVELNSAEIAYLSTPAGEHEGLTKILKLSESNLPQDREQIDKLKDQLHRAATQNGLRDSVLTQMNAFLANEEAFVGDIEETTKREIAYSQSVLQEHPEDFVSELRYFVEERRSSLEEAQKEVQTKVNEIDQAITTGQDPEDVLATWKASIILCNKITERMLTYERALDQERLQVTS